MNLFTRSFPLLNGWAKKPLALFAIFALIASSGVSFFINPNYALAVDTTFLFAGSTHSSENDWTNANNVFANDGVYATGRDSSSHDEQSFSDFGFSIPSGSSIDGIEIKIEAKSADTNGCRLEVDLSSNDGGNFGDNENTSSLTGSDVEYTLGGSTNTWGDSWTSDDFSNSNFVVRVKIDDVSGNTCDSDKTVSVDYVSAKVYYTEPIQPVENPILENSCGLDVALVLDSSGSIGDDMSTMKAAMKDFVDAFLPGTPTLFSVTDFDTTGVVLQGFTADVSDIKDAIDTPISGGFTNWEDGLEKAYGTFDPRGDHPNLIVFASDGNPTEDNGSGDPLDNAIDAANTIKTAGTRIITLGIGSNVNTDNLEAISSADAVYESDFDTLATDLATLAEELCGGTVTVTKVIDADGNPETTEDQTPAENWEFTIDGEQYTTDDSGMTEAVEVDQGTYDVVETTQNNYDLVNAYCTGATNNGSWVDNAVEDVEIGSQDIVSCTFVNVLKTAELTVTKIVINDDQTGSSEVGDFTLSVGETEVVSGESNAFTPGDYTVSESGPGGYLATYEGDCDENGDITLLPGESYSCTITNDDVPPEVGTIQGVKFEDVDNDGVAQEEDEPELSGWTIRLYEVGDPWTLLMSTTTDETGAYSFEGIPLGSYKVCELSQEGWTQTFATYGSENLSPNSSEEGEECSTANLDEDDEVATRNFGNYHEPTPEPICVYNEELLENGSFESPVVQHAKKWNIFPSETVGLGWVVDWFGGSLTYSGEDRPDIANLELHRGVNGWLASDGEQYAELDGDWVGPDGSLNGEPAAVEISQTVFTEVGETYTFSFDFSPRPNTDADQNKLEVLVNGSVVGTVGPLAGSSNTSWTNHEFSFVADTIITTVSLRDAGTPNDSLGTFVDNASLMCVEVNQCEDEPNGGWSDTVVDSEQGLKKDGGSVPGNRSNTSDVLGEADWTSGGSSGFYSLGFGGWIVVAFDTFVPNVDGDDISIHEATNGSYPSETALIEVSQTGESDDWHEVGTADNDGVSYFDFAGTGLSWIKYVRITDTTDPGLHNNSADGFDLDAIDATETVCTEPEPQFASVTLCKYDEEQNPLSGWTLMLLGDEVDSFTVDAADINGVDSVSLTGGSSYAALAGGVWLNDRNPDNHVDPEYSTEDGWSTHMDGFTGYGAGILELEIGEEDGDWGPYNSLHEYAQSFTPLSDGPVNFRIFDGDTNTHTIKPSWYGDNKGELGVSIYEGYAGVTDESGCVEFNNVPYGEYVATEIPQADWTQVDGPDNPVQIDTEIVELSLVNTENTNPSPDTATLHVTKIVCEAEEYLPNWGNGSYGPITETTATDWLANGDNSEHCWLQPDWEFQWVTDSDSSSNPGDNSGEAGSPWTTFGVTDNDGVITTTIPSGEKVWVREVLKDGYVEFSGQNTNQDESAEIYCATDVLNYDNWDWINPVNTDETYYCVAWNAPLPGSPSLTVIKETYEYDGEFNFEIDGFQFFDSFSIETDEGIGSTEIQLEQGTYTLSEILGQSWELVSAYCEDSEGQFGSPTQTGYELTLFDGDSVTCTFVNETTCGEGEHYDSELQQCESNEGDAYADLSVLKTVSDNEPQEGDQITYTITVENNGPNSSGTIVVSDLLPDGVTYVSHDASVGTYDPNTGEWDGFTLGDEGVATLEIVVEVDQDTEGDEITNSASVSSTSVDEDSENDSDYVSIYVTNEEDGNGGSSEPEQQSTPIGNGSPSLFGLGGGGFVLGASTSNGQVLGEACGLYMDRFLRLGYPNNDTEQVIKLQEFLNKHGFGILQVTGFFGVPTENAVKAFQNAHSAEILTPWGINEPTGLVYLTTLRQINLIECPELSIQIPPLTPWSFGQRVANSNAQGSGSGETEEVMEDTTTDENQDALENQTASAGDAMKGEKRGGFWSNVWNFFFSR